MVLSKVKHLVETNDMIIADTSEPRLIQAMQSQGIYVIKTEKYAGSVVDGIRLINDFQLVVTPESYNMKYELRNYIWNDKKASIPLDMDNHGADALRYASVKLLEGSDLLAYN